MKRRIFLFQSILLICCGTYILRAQNGMWSYSTPVEPVPTVRHISVEDGLPSNTVRALYKDEQGFLWIGTDAGLSRYDGSTFVHYTAHDGLPGEKVWAITSDGKGKLWIGCYGGGICSFDGRRFAYPEEGKGTPDDRVRTLFYMQSEGLLYVGLEHGLRTYRFGKRIPMPFKGTDPEALRTVTSISGTGDSLLITTYQQGVFLYRPGSGELGKFREVKYLKNSSSSSLFRLSDGRLGISNGRKGVLLYDPRSGRNQYDTTIAQVFSMDQDRQGKLWIAVWSYDMREPGGIYQWDGTRAISLNEKLGISSQQCWQVVCDTEEDMVWIATLGEGIYQVLPPIVTHLGAEEISREAFNVEGLLSDSQGRLWVGTATSLLALLPDMRMMQANQQALENLALKYFADEFRRDGKPWTPADVAFYLSRVGNYNALREDDEGRIWVSFNGGGAMVDKDGGIRFVKHLDKKHFDLTPDGQLVFGVWNGFGIASPKFQWFIAVEKESPEQSELVRNNVQDIRRIRDEVWISSSSQGLFRYRERKMTPFSPENSAIYHNVLSVTGGPAGTLIAAEHHGQIKVFRAPADSLEIICTLDRSSGLVGQAIQWMVYDPVGYLWIGTDKGIQALRFRNLADLEDPRFIFIDKEEGLKVYPAWAAVLHTDGRLVVGGPQGLDIIHTRRVYAGLKSGGLLLPRFAMVDFQLLTDSILNTMGVKEKTAILRVDYHTNHLLLGFNHPNLLNPAKDRYRFRLEGVDSVWSPWQPEPVVVLGRMPGGRHFLVMERRNLAGLWEPVRFRMLIDVPLPWYRSLWGIALFAAILLGMLWLSYRLARRRTRRIERARAELKERMAELEVKALQAQMNPHFIFNSINAIQGYILQDKPDEAIAYLADFSRVVRDSLEHVSQKYISLAEALAFVESYLRLEGMRFPGKFDWNIRMAEGLDPRSVLIPPMMIQPYVENAITHGLRRRPGGGLLNMGIAIDRGRGLLLLEIEDNGIGVRRSDTIGPQRADAGLARRIHSGDITARRIRMMNPPGKDDYGVFVSESVPGDEYPGCRVSISLPLLEA